jgi:hypothetical protein
MTVDCVRWVRQVWSKSGGEGLQATGRAPRQAVDDDHAAAAAASSTAANARVGSKCVI